MRPDIYWDSVDAVPPAPKSGWDADKWAVFASQYGHFQEGTVPLAGAIMVVPSDPSNSLGALGHVAYVTQVYDNDHFVTQEMNTDGNTTPDKVFTVFNYSGSEGPDAFAPSRTVLAGTVFIYGGPVISPPQYAGYLGHIVQWDGDTKAQKTAWLVIDDHGQLRRRWVPDIPTYWCLKNAGAPGPDVLSSTVLNAMADETGQSATCSGNSTPPPGGVGGGGGTVGTTTTSPPSGGGGTTATATCAELEGHYGVNTFSDPQNASGLGQRINAGQQVEVSCKVYAPEIASVNPDGYWYLIASAPWDNGYYAPANTFMNGDPWNGPYTHNTDFNVPDCGAGPVTTSATTPPPPTGTVPTTTTSAAPSR
jgi:hypothetical protein